MVRLGSVRQGLEEKGYADKKTNKNSSALSWVRSGLLFVTVVLSVLKDDHNETYRIWKKKKKPLKYQLRIFFYV